MTIFELINLIVQLTSVVLQLTSFLIFKLVKFIREHMSLVTRKPVLGYFDQVRLKPACSVTETS